MFVEAESARHETLMWKRKYESFRKQVEEDRADIDILREKLLKKDWESNHSSHKSREGLENIPGQDLGESSYVGTLSTGLISLGNYRSNPKAKWKNIAEVDKLNINLTLRSVELEIQVREW